MSQIRILDNALRQGLGLGASLAIGTTFSVYRLNANSTGNWCQPSNLINDNFQAKFAYAIPKALVEQTDTYKMWYTAMCDTRQLLIGDILLETGPTLTDEPDGRGYVFSDVRPLQVPVFARVDFFGSLSRSNTDSHDAEPLQGDAGYQGTTKDNEWTYQLFNGNFFVDPTGQPCAIPIGMQNYVRLGPGQAMKGDVFPTETPRAVFFCYIPILPGVIIQPGDIISNSIGDRFQIENIALNTVGLQGYQIIAHSVFI